MNFNPRTPLQSAIKELNKCYKIEEFQSTHSVTECDSMYFTSWMIYRTISIHALRYRVRCTAPITFNVASTFQSTHSVTECDLARPSPIPLGRYFNPRTPLQSAMGPGKRRINHDQNFNPRTPLQSAMLDCSHFAWWRWYFNPRTPLQSAIPYPPPLC